MNTSSISAFRHDVQCRLMLTLLAQVRIKNPKIERIQIGLPIFMGIVVFIVCLPMIIDYFTTGFFDATEAISKLYYVSASYPIASAVPTLIVIKPYRTFVTRFFRKETSNVIIQIPVSTVSQRSSFVQNK